MKKIIIIGGGISGLAVLHYIKKRYQETVEVTLIEKNSDVGGTIASFESQGSIFETGPNGFLTNQPNTLEFIKDLGFLDQLIEANEDSKRRYIQMNGKLHLLPMDPVNFFKTPLLSATEKIRLIQGLFKKNISKDQSVYDYTAERFGPAVASRLVDPFLTGIYAGDIKRLHMGAAFPKMGTPKGQPKAKMCSFVNGMGSLIGQLALKYKSSIQIGVEVKDLAELKADTIICATPAYVAAELFGMPILQDIYYSPVAVVGMLIKKDSFKRLPDGFGYLIPSGEGKEVLGVLIESNVYTRQTSKDQIFLRVMMGGAHHPGIASYTKEQLQVLALKEIDEIYGLKEDSSSISVKLWTKGIPQYELDYPAIRQAITEELKKKQNLFLCANYLDGISFNDCIKNAKELVDSL
ncbi:MAG: protoporphyrinogen oxidase [Candidatus Omnitrophica bacterium]|nr:protoporphyrinogen oxidase [Candidatus Omnitrophota bacterium]